MLLKIMNINRSGYYAWRNRRGKLNRYEQDRLDLTKLLKEQHKKHKCYGYHNLAEAVRTETGWVFSDNLAHKCCKHAGIRSLARKTYHPTKGKEHIKYGNIVAGNWNATEPMQIVVSDMTMIKTKYCNWEWTFAVDTYNNEIIASSISRKVGDTKTYIDVARQVADKAKEQTRPVTFHTDQGSVYSSQAFLNAHSHCTNIIRSMSRVGTPTDNPIIEALNGWIKEELRIDFDVYHCKDVPTLIQNYIIYYNTERPSAKCGRKSPVQFRTEQGFPN